MENSDEGDVYTILNRLFKDKSYVKVAEELVKSSPNFEEEGFSEYQNGKLLGIIFGMEYMVKHYNISPKQEEIDTKKSIKL